MLLAKRMKELRMDRGLTQKELGEIINVTKVSICCYENSTRTRRHCCRQHERKRQKRYEWQKKKSN